MERTTAFLLRTSLLWTGRKRCFRDYGWLGKLAFENESVQVVNVHYGPHEKSVLHAHPGGVVVVLTEGHLRFTDGHGKTQEVFAKPGESRWFPPFKHRVENLGDTAYNAVYIGIKKRKTD